MRINAITPKNAAARYAAAIGAKYINAAIDIISITQVNIIITEGQQ
jgi:hypothetical protein